MAGARDERRLWGAYASDCSAPQLRNENPSRAQVLLYLQANFDQADDTTLALDSFSETFRPAKSDDRQRCRRVFLPDGLFEGVRIVHVAVVCQEYHPVGLGKPPHSPVTTVHG